MNDRKTDQQNVWDTRRLTRKQPGRQADRQKVNRHTDVETNDKEIDRKTKSSLRESKISK